MARSLVRNSTVPAFTNQWRSTRIWLRNSTTQIANFVGIGRVDAELQTPSSEVAASHAAKKENTSEGTEKVPGTHSEASKLVKQHNNEVRRAINDGRVGRENQCPAADTHSLTAMQKGTTRFTIQWRRPKPFPDLTGCGAHTEREALDMGSAT